MSLRTKQTLSVSTGAGPTFTAATASDTMQPGNNVWAEYRSVSASTATITVVMPTALTLETGVDYPDKVYTLAAGGGAGNIVPSELRIPLIKIFQDGSTGLVTITCSPTTSVTMAVVER
jgi:hypothetical protein